MKKVSTLLKLSLVAVLIVCGTKASAQTNISSIAEFKAANAKIDDLSQVICAGKNVILSLPTPDANTTYTWSSRFPSDDGTGTGVPVPAAVAGVVTDTPPAAGYYTYMLTVTNTLSQCTEAYPTTVFVLPSPTLVITPPTDAVGCTNATEDFAFTSVASNNTTAGLSFPLDYQWFYKNGTGAEVAVANSNAATFTATGLTATIGDYKVYARATFKLKACTLSESNQADISIKAAPTKPTVTIASN